MLGNLRGSGPFPFFVENVNATVVTTNLATGGTLTRKFADSGRDHTIVDNGDGTITITMHAQGIVRYSDQFGRFVLKDPGSLWTSFDLDNGGTPGDPSDDVEAEGSFQVVRTTGNSNVSDRDFCADLRLFTTP